ncbi:hypothetical protein [Thalassobacillus sp. C254]|uniref:hypothetical protein n=1 Tax=Thalassobacillus sp. C254 TaxID=1225341 RepID=UPI0022B62A5C|nr:hypothetical protein [Thalassobacillus sp. C254]
MLSKHFLLIVTRWVLIGGIIGLIIGSTTALLLHTNDFLGELRKQTSWLILFLPFGGLLIGYMYMTFGPVGEWIYIKEITW